MNPTLSSRALLAWLVSLIAIGVVHPSIGANASNEAKVTRIIHEVKLLPEGAKARPATLNDEVNADTGVRTGDRSRSELTFVDLTIERLGANTVFHFDRAGRSVELDGGSMLLRVPKDSGGAQMQTRAVTVGISGTTVILESSKSGNKLIVLEGSARLSLRRYPRESANVHGGQMEDVPAGATKLPPPVNVNLADVMHHHPLITDFGPLPSQDLIEKTMQDQPVIGQPVNGGPVMIPPIVGNILGGAGAIAIGAGSGGGNSHGHAGHIPNRQGKGSNGTRTSNPTGYPNRAKPTPAPTPHRKSNPG